MCACEIWTITKAENQRIDAFELWCWRRLLKVPWIARRSNLSVLKEISPEYSLKGLMLKLKLQYFGHLMWRTNSLEKRLQYWVRLKAGAEEDDRGWDGWWHHWLKGHEFGQTPGDGDDREAWCAAVHGAVKSQTWLGNWTTRRLEECPLQSPCYMNKKWETCIWPTVLLLLMLWKTLLEAKHSFSLPFVFTSPAKNSKLEISWQGILGNVAFGLPESCSPKESMEEWG